MLNTTDSNFIRCSALVAELLLKYQSKMQNEKDKKEKNKESGESDKDSSPIFVYLLLQISLSSFIIYNAGDYC